MSLLHSLTLIESQSYPIGSLDQSLSARNVSLYFCWTPELFTACWMDLIFAWHQLLPGWRVFNPIRCAVLVLHYICLLISDKPVNPPLITIADLIISNLREYREARISWHLLCVSIPEDENCCRCLSFLFDCHSMAWQLQDRGCDVPLQSTLIGAPCRTVQLNLVHRSAGGTY